MNNIFHYIIIVVILFILSTSITNAYAQESGNTQRFTDNGDEAITDTQTKLIWAHPDRNMWREQSWTYAVKSCELLNNLRGTKGFRLPNYSELSNLSVALYNLEDWGAPGYRTRFLHEIYKYYWTGTTYDAGRNEWRDSDKPQKDEDEGLPSHVVIQAPYDNALEVIFGRPNETGWKLVNPNTFEYRGQIQVVCVRHE